MMATVELTSNGEFPRRTGIKQLCVATTDQHSVGALNSFPHFIDCADVELGAALLFPSDARRYHN